MSGTRGTVQHSQSEVVDAIIAYHELSKHHPDHFARGPGGLDWRTSPARSGPSQIPPC